MPRRVTKRMTQLQVDQVGLPRRGRQDQADGMIPGLRFHWTSSGARFWKLHRGGTSRRVADANDGDTLDDARLKALAAIRAGDPIVALGGRQKPAHGPTLAEAAGLYFERGMIVRKGPLTGQPLTTAPAIRRRLESKLLPALGSRPVADLERKEVTQLLDAISDDAGPGAALSTFQNLMTLLKWCAKKGHIAANPIEGLDAPVGIAARDRVLTDAELAAVWHGSFRMHPAHGAFIRLMILTSLRRNEVALLHHSEIEDGRVIVLPPPRTKNGVELRLPIVGLMKDEFAKLPTEGFLFSVTPGKPISTFTTIKQEIDKLSGVHGWRFHDLRRTARSGFSKVGVPLEIAERLMNHKQPKIVAVYDHHRYDEQIGQALSKWHAYLNKLVSEQAGNVVPLRK